jgi:hypothetical protein
MTNNARAALLTRAPALALALAQKRNVNCLFCIIHVYQLSFESIFKAKVRTSLKRILGLGRGKDKDRGKGKGRGGRESDFTAEHSILSILGILTLPSNYLKPIILRKSGFAQLAIIRIRRNMHPYLTNCAFK